MRTTSMTLSLKQLFATIFLLGIGLLAASALQAWTGPTATAPNGNVAAPINVGTTDQVKNAGLSLNSLAIFGRAYVQSGLNIGTVIANQIVALDVNGAIKIGNGGEVCQAVTAGAIRYSADAHVMQYCDGTTWWTMAVVGQTVGRASCGNPTNLGNNIYAGTGEQSGNASSLNDCIAAGEAANAAIIEYSSTGNYPVCFYGPQSITDRYCTQYGCGCGTGNCWPDTKEYQCTYSQTIYPY